MPYANQDLLKLLRAVELGVSVAEQDSLLQAARVETSAFSDLLSDRVDLITGTKGSGKSALYRFVVEFLPDVLLRSRKVVIAHGVQRTGDNVFHVFKDRFERMSEQDFVSFWCVYLVSLANEHFVKGERYQAHLAGCVQEIRRFRVACDAARIPEFKEPKSLKSVLEWALEVVGTWRPKVKYRPPGESGEFELGLFGYERQSDAATDSQHGEELPRYVNEIAENLEAILRKADLSLWLMVDRLDELFLRRSRVETLALRGLLRTLRIFASPQIRVKIFLRDDILEQIAAEEDGFANLTHVTARQADPLRWS